MNLANISVLFTQKKLQGVPDQQNKIQRIFGGINYFFILDIFLLLVNFTNTLATMQGIPIDDRPSPRQLHHYAQYTGLPKTDIFVLRKQPICPIPNICRYF